MQDQFIASLDLPTYHNFTQYQFLDLLDALSFRLMVLDHIKRTNYQSNLPTFNKQITSGTANEFIPYEMEKEIKIELQ